MIVKTTLFALLLATVSTVLYAQGTNPADPSYATYPTKEITLVVPYSQGGPTDRIARPVAAGLATELGVPVVLEYQPGLGGTKAPRALAAAPDTSGYTLLIHHISMATAPTLYRNLGYAPLRDFAPIGQVADVPMVLLGRHGLLPAGRDLGRFLKQKQDELLVAYSGAGSASQMCTLLLEAATGARLFWVSYKGSAPAMKDIANQRVDFYCDQATNALASLAAGTASAYAVTAPHRLDLRPNIPTTGEAGLNGVQISVFQGMYAMAGTPQPIVNKISDALQRVVASPRFIAAMNQQGAVTSPVNAATPRSLARLVRKEAKRWRPIIRRAGQYAD